MAQQIANISVLQCLDKSCKAVPKIDYEFTSGHKKLIVLVCGSHRQTAENYGRQVVPNWELNIRNWPDWLKKIQEKELARSKEGDG